MEELLSLKWNNHRSTFLHILTVLRDKQLYTDATLACEGRFYSVHKLVLSTCSDYFSAMFDRTTCKNPIIVLKDIKCEDLEALLDYMYLGEVNVRQADLASLIKAAECLRVKGLAVPDDEPPKKGSHSDSSVRRHDGTNSPPAKRKRRTEDQDGREDVRPNGSQRLKSPQSHSRLSPVPQDSLSDSGRPSSPSQQQPSESATGASKISETPFVKVEMEDNPGIDLDSYDMPNDSYKEEHEDDPGDLSNDLPEFLQQDSVPHSQGSSSFSHGSFPGTSFQPGDLPGWQGEGSNANFPSHMNYASSTDSSQTTPGVYTSRDQNVGDHSQVVIYHSNEVPPRNTGDACSRKLHLCHFCQKNFTCPSKLERHIRIHTGEKPYVCFHCAQAFSQRATLNRHIRMHCDGRKIGKRCWHWSACLRESEATPT